jgi:hypothetical protein
MRLGKLIGPSTCVRARFLSLSYKSNNNKVREPQIIAGSLPQSPEKCVISSRMQSRGRHNNALSVSATIKVIKRELLSSGFVWAMFGKSEISFHYSQWIGQKVNLFENALWELMFSEEMRRHARPLCSSPAAICIHENELKINTHPRRLAAADFKPERLISLIGSCDL